MGPLRLYLRYAGISVRSQMQYRASFLLGALGQFTITSVEFLAVWALFDRFGRLGPWGLPEVALLYGMANVAFALAEGFGRGFDVFPSLVKSGDFDRLLLRPRGTAFQVAAGEVQLLRIGRLAQGLAVLGWAALRVEGGWSLPPALLLAGSVLGGACLFAGLFVLQATFSFWTTEGLEIVNVVTYGGVEAGQYPVGIYPRAFRQFLTWVLPLAFLNSVPAAAILGQDFGPALPAWVPWCSPAVGPLFLLACLLAWRRGVRRYRSTGS